MTNDTPGLTNYDFADFELLETIGREQKGTTQDLAETLNREIRKVASRLSWMRKEGLIERTIAENWILTAKGMEMLNGRSEDIMAVRSIAGRARRSKPVAWVIRREMQRNDRKLRGR